MGAGVGAGVASARVVERVDVRLVSGIILNAVEFCVDRVAIRPKVCYEPVECGVLMERC